MGEAIEDTGLAPLPPRPTGRTLVLLREGATAKQAETVLKNEANIGTANVQDFAASRAGMESALASGTAVVMPELGVAVVPQAATRTMGTLERISASEAVEEVRPEFYMFAIHAGAAYQDTASATWGMAATGAEKSYFTGKGIKIAILDTGIDLQHPDFAGRHIVSRSFVPGQEVQDVQGHGTHCAGTAAGATQDAGIPRYGVAPEAELFVGKVLSDNGSGEEGWILAGMEWAITSGCEIISMSLGRPVARGERPDPLYERAGRKAWARGCLIVAAAGNESSRRYNYVAPVGAPANVPTIMAVAAVDPLLKVAEFSCGEINAGGGEIDIAAPVVGIFSSFPRPQLYRKLPGTSMACPHVAGIAALWAQSDVSKRGEALFKALKAAAIPLSDHRRDIGAGLVWAPDAPTG